MQATNARAHLPVMNRTQARRLSLLKHRKQVEWIRELAVERRFNKLFTRARAEESCRILGLDPAEVLR